MTEGTEYGLVKKRVSHLSMVICFLLIWKLYVMLAYDADSRSAFLS